MPEPLRETTNAVYAIKQTITNITDKPPVRIILEDREQGELLAQRLRTCPSAPFSDESAAVKAEKGFNFVTIAGVEIAWPSK